MSHQDQDSGIVINHQDIKQVIDEFFPANLFARKKPGQKGFWTSRWLAITAFLWVLSPKTGLIKAFGHARKILGKMFRLPREEGDSYQGFIKMLAKWHLRLMLTIPPQVRVKMKEKLPGQWEIEGFVVFAADGSRIELCRTQSLQEAFAPQRSQPTSRHTKKKSQQQKAQARKARAGQRKKHKKQSAESREKKAASPQMWLTMLWHVGSGLPWDWRKGPSDSSEREHLREMLCGLPENALITADAGFVGYDLWKMLVDCKRHFVIRVGSNVRLLRKLGFAREHDQTVYLWPDSAAKKKQPPLTLRLIVIHNGKHPLYLVTNATKSRLSEAAAGRIYQARWGVELFFRTLKQTFGRRKLRSRCPRCAELELDWSVLALWCVCLRGQMELLTAGEPPDRLSAAKALDAFQETLSDYRVRPETASERLWSRLGCALLDNYERSSSKESRNYPRKNQRKSPGIPEITNATRDRIINARKIKKGNEIWLTA